MPVACENGGRIGRAWRRPTTLFWVVSLAIIGLLLAIAIPRAHAIVKGEVVLEPGGGLFGVSMGMEPEIAFRNIERWGFDSTAVVMDENYSDICGNRLPVAGDTITLFKDRFWPSSSACIIVNAGQVVAMDVSYGPWFYV